MFSIDRQCFQQVTDNVFNIQKQTTDNVFNRQYGDHLYSKRDYEGAIVQYIKTIGRLEPSYVIRKFLDAQRIHNLTAYLQVGVV